MAPVEGGHFYSRYFFRSDDFGQGNQSFIFVLDHQPSLNGSTRVTVPMILLGPYLLAQVRMIGFFFSREHKRERAFEEG